MVASPSLTIWRERHDRHLFRCVAEQLGEECFELRLFRSGRLLTSQTFDEPGPMLLHASELREQFTHSKGRDDDQVR